MLDLKINKFDSIQMWTDITKFITIILVYHIFSYIIDDKGESFLDENILKILLYVTMGIVTYYLIIKKNIIQPLLIKEVKNKINKKMKKIDNKHI